MPPKKMNLADFNGPQANDLPSAPSDQPYEQQGGGYGGRSYGDRDGGRGGYGGDRGGDREDRGPRRRFNEDGEEEPEGPSRADEADKWRRAAPARDSERRPEEMPGRSDNDDKWRPRGGDRPAGGFGSQDSRDRPSGSQDSRGDRPSGGYSRDGPRGFGGDRGGDRDGDRPRYGGGDRDGGRDGGRFGGDRDGGRGGDGGDRDRGYGGGRDAGRDGGAGGDSRPAHLKALTKRGGSSDNISGQRDESSPAAPVGNDRFRKPPPEEGEGGEEREERGAGRDGGRDGGDRPRFGGDRDGGDRPRFGGDRDGGDRPRYGGGDRDGGDRPRFGGGDRDGGDRPRFGGDRDGGDRPRFGGGDRDGGRSGGYQGRSGGYGGDRDGGGSRYGGYGASRPSAMDMNAPLPTGPASRAYEDEPRPQRLQLQKKKEQLEAKPLAKEERKVEVDESVAGKGVVSLAAKNTPLDNAVDANLTVTEEQLAESMARVKLDKQERVEAYGNVLAKSLIDGTVSLGALTVAASNKSAPQLLISSLTQLKQKKSDKVLLDLVNAARAKNPELDILGFLTSEEKDPKARDAFLEKHGLLVLKPIPDLTKGVQEQLDAGAKPDAILKSINDQVDAKLAPGSKVAQAIAAHIFAQAFATAGKVDVEAVKPWAPLIARVAPGSDQEAQMRVLFEAQYAWFKAGATKALLKELFLFLFNEKQIRPQAFAAWSNDTADKGAKGKMKALLQVTAWITEIQPKVRAEEEPTSDADEDLEREFGDGNE